MSKGTQTVSTQPVSMLDVFATFNHEIGEMALLELLIKRHAPMTQIYKEVCEGELRKRMHNLSTHAHNQASLPFDDAESDGLDGASTPKKALPAARKPAEDEGESSGSEYGGLRRRVLAYAAQHRGVFASKKFIAEDTASGHETDIGSVYSALGRMVHKGQAKRLRPGVYQIGDSAKTTQRKPPIPKMQPGEWREIFNKVSHYKRDGDFNWEDVKRVMSWEQLPGSAYAAISNEVGQGRFERVSPGVFRKVKTEE